MLYMYTYVSTLKCYYCTRVMVRIGSVHKCQWEYCELSRRNEGGNPWNINDHDLSKRLIFQVDKQKIHVLDSDFLTEIRQYFASKISCDKKIIRAGFFEYLFLILSQS